MTGEVVHLKQVSKTFKNKKVLQNINLTLQEGECVALLGKNGAGKSTLLNLILGLFYPTEGEITVSYSKKEIGFLSQESRFPTDVKVNEMLGFVASFSDNPLTEIEVNQVLQFSKEQKNQFIHTLSGGQRRLFDVCLALLNRPKFLVIDEPTAGMDTSTRHHFWSIIQEMKDQGMTILYTTHYMEEVEHCADQVILLDQGMVKAMDTPYHLRTMNRKKCLSFEKETYQLYQEKLEEWERLKRIDVVEEKDSVSWHFDNEETLMMMEQLIDFDIPLTHIELRNSSLLHTLFEGSESEEGGRVNESID